MNTQNPPSEPLPVKPEIGLPDAILAIVKYFAPDWSKIGIWRPLVVAALAYFGYDNRQIHTRHKHTEAVIADNSQQIEEVKSFVQSPPTNGRRIHESTQLPPLPSTNRITIRQK